jgi:glycosyltransferase involved in cell wall biosynthesis
MRKAEDDHLTEPVFGSNDERVMEHRTRALLCVVNFPANTGFAWDFFEGLYARLANELRPLGIRTLVAYPAISQPPRPLAGSAAEAVSLDVSLRSLHSVFQSMSFIRRTATTTVFFFDRPARSWTYLLLRAAGVKRIIVYDQTSGERTKPSPPKRLAKWLLGRTPGIVADSVLCVSDYIAARQVEVGQIPAGRVHRVWNGINVDSSAGAASVHTRFGIDRGRPVVLATCRAAAEKGLIHLFRAFDQVVSRTKSHTIDPVLLYVGDGPQLRELQDLRSRLSARDAIVVAGYQPNAASLHLTATFSVAPSVWQEGFGLAVLEPMSAGRAVVATRTGAIPEIVLDGETGLLVPPGDEEALADAIQYLLLNPARASTMGEAGRRRAELFFSPEAQMRQLVAIVSRSFGTVEQQPRRD